MASKSFVVPSILVSDERIYRIPGKDKVCRSCGAARDTAKAIISNEIHEEKKLIALKNLIIQLPYGSRILDYKICICRF